MHFTKKMIHPNGHTVELGGTTLEGLKVLLARKVDAGFRPTDDPVVDVAAKEEAERKAKKAKLINVEETAVLPPEPLPDATSDTLPEPPSPKKSRKKK